MSKTVTLGGERLGSGSGNKIEIGGFTSRKRYFRRKWTQSKRKKIQN